VTCHPGGEHPIDGPHGRWFYDCPSYGPSNSAGPDVPGFGFDLYGLDD
jgi:hypothetical protein